MGTDSLYYIRDYSGNYYRINNVNELVAVRNETDATVFNYDQAKSHIGTGKKSAFYRAIPIETEDGNDGGNIAFNSVDERSRMRKNRMKIFRLSKSLLMTKFWNSRRKAFVHIICRKWIGQSIWHILLMWLKGLRIIVTN